MYNKYMQDIRIVVTSDSHGNKERLFNVRNQYDSSWIFLDCGDSCLSEKEMKQMGILSVQGNNDYFSSFPLFRVLEYGKHRIYMTHGHRVMFYNRYDMLAEEARRHECDIALCGHSHIPHEEIVNGILCLNPGSLFRNRDLSDPSYLTLVLHEEGWNIQKHTLK